MQAKNIWTIVVGVGVVLALGVSIAHLVDMRNETAVLRSELTAIKIQNDDLKAKNERLFTLVVSLVKDGAVALDILKPFITEVEASEISKKVAESQKEQLPFPLDTKFYPSGWMGDGEYGEKYVSYKRRPGSIDNKSTTIIQLSYRKGPKGWAGIYWQFPDGNCGNQPGRNLIGAKKITFFARGERGGEIVEFKSGGIRGQNSDSYEVSLGKVVLNKEWSQYTIDLSKSDLSNVIGGFAWVVSAIDNEAGEVITYIAELTIE